MNYILFSKVQSLRYIFKDTKVSQTKILITDNSENGHQYTKISSWFIYMYIYSTKNIKNLPKSIYHLIDLLLNLYLYNNLRK